MIDRCVAGMDRSFGPASLAHERFCIAFLDSEGDHRDPKNLTLALTETGKPRFKDLGINDPAGHFKGKLIRVTGVVTLKDNRPHIEVDDPGQIQVVEKNK